MSAPLSPSTLYDQNGSPVGTSANPLYVAGGTGGGGGGGGPVTEADGANVTLGAKADLAATTPAAVAPWSAIALLKGIWGRLPAVGVTGNPSADVLTVQSPSNQPLSTKGTAGLGALTAVPAGSTNGTALGTMPAGAQGARLYLPTGASITFAVASAAPSSAPTTFTISASTTGPNWDENLSGGQMIYVTAVSGSPLFRWY